jgi:hypothetical protein
MRHAEVELRASRSLNNSLITLALSPAFAQAQYGFAPVCRSRKGVPSIGTAPTATRPAGTQ